MQYVSTPRLILRNFLPSDAEALFDYLADPRANCFLDEKLNSLDEARADAEQRSKSNNHLAVCLKDTGRVIGDLFLYPEEKFMLEEAKGLSVQALEPVEADTYSVGWNFNAQFEGKGYAYESAAALFEYLFQQKNVRRIYAYVEDDNHRSQALCEKLGMRQEGCFMEFVTFVNHDDGTPKYENTYQYAILKKEWLKQRSLEQESEER
ncbi:MULTISPECIES: GNAT family N-acetyltransferase [Marinomonas]|uniref:GNAT family N-acetyltransferase n=1 Tax=Marinomonas rhodophyticola TaxID=2992803 RepID=A0ABT3KHM3_9GAMM|nr:GNAT family protein [Marinomonas sp. KJ51-3]MCW4630039.1 GNAT family N-acetyltransferase [Marinomonas sp. KJ51-3]